MIAARLIDECYEMGRLYYHAGTNTLFMVTARALDHRGIQRGWKIEVLFSDTVRYFNTMSYHSWMETSSVPFDELLDDPDWDPFE